MGIASAKMCDFFLQHCKSAFNVMEEVLAQVVESKLIYLVVSQT